MRGLRGLSGARRPDAGAGAARARLTFRQAPMPDTGRVSVARQAKLWQWAAVAYVVAAAVFFSFMPLITVPTASGAVTVAAYAMLGWMVFPPLLIPLVLMIVPLVVRRHRVRIAWICTGLLGAICVLMIMSVGMLFIPAALFGAVGAYLTARAPIEDEEIEEIPWQMPDA
ncbi:MAG: hypothetical protein QM582_02175 [Micropruina sp.]|uniref:hypothetical protein n=1 Tax=Micropruina sp. TaxID=2737536 RepID=UPI0039E6C012